MTDTEPTIERKETGLRILTYRAFPIHREHGAWAD